jgi:hypothetical protein
VIDPHVQAHVLVLGCLTNNSEQGSGPRYLM